MVDRENSVIELQHNRLSVAFPDVHPKAKCSVEFQRTLRVPDDNQEYPLPAGLGQFPILPVDDFEVPPAWKQHGGVFFPMYQSEAMWINFNARGDYPFAVKIAAGKINAVTGKAWNNALSRDSQDYVVVPEQLWLDGFSAAKDVVRQFVAMPLGEGVTAEEQITGEAEWGGLQLIFYPMKADEYRKRIEQPREAERLVIMESQVMFCRSASYDMGLAPGGRIKQEIAEDPYGLEVWDTSVSSRCFVHLLNSEMYRKVTGQAPPTKPISAKQYADAKVPWFDYYLDGKVLTGSSILAGLDGIAAALLKKSKKLDDNKPIPIAKTVDLSERGKLVRDGSF
jgi:hypothetical protein